jgi:hypothetical protein
MKEVNGSDIIYFLEKMFSLKLPAYGILAGQAVASAYFELTKKNYEPVYNDIDVFIYNRSYTKTKEYDNKSIIHTDDLKISLINDYPETMEHPRLNFEIKNPYKIIDTTRAGLLNRIMVSKNISGKRLINGFDLNCVQIGIDLQTKNLFKTKEFDEYIKTGILKVVSYASPHHTAIRLMSKKHISNKIDNIEKEMLKIGTFIDLDNKWVKADSDINDFGYFPFFGIKRFKDYDTYTDLKKYFDIYSHKDFDMFQLSPVFKTKAIEVDLEMNSLIDSFKNKMSRANIGEKEKLYLIYKNESFFFQEKNKKSFYFIKNIKINTLLDVFGESRFKKLSKKHLGLLIKNIDIISLLSVKNKSFLKDIDDDSIFKLIENIHYYFKDKKPTLKKSNKYKIIKNDLDLSFKKVDYFNRYLQLNGDLDFLLGDVENFEFFEVKVAGGLYSYERYLFTIKDNELLFLNNKSKKSFFNEQCLLLKDVVNSKVFKEVLFKEFNK